MASTVSAEVEDKEALSRLALLTFIAWETGAEGQVPGCLDVQDDQVLLRCHVCEHDITDLPRLQAFRQPDLDELDTAERDLAQMGVPLSGSGLWPEFDCGRPAPFTECIGSCCGRPEC